MSEADLMRQIQIAASGLGARLFRQNVGMAWIGQTVYGNGQMVRLNKGDVLIRNARPFISGVKGMSDLGGWMPVTVTGEMVGQQVAVCAQVEVKLNGRLEKSQRQWLEAVRAAGGMAGVARSVDDLSAILGTPS